MLQAGPLSSMPTLLSLKCADTPEEIAAEVEEASKERLQDLTTALCKNTEVGAMGSDIPRWSTQGTADPSISMDSRNGPGTSSAYWMASGQLPDCKAACNAGSIEDTSTMHFLQACKGMSGEAFKAMSGVAPPAGAASGKLDASAAEVDSSQPGDTAMPARCRSLCSDSACPSRLH